MATPANSSLPPAALQASRAALSAALADQESSASSNAADQSQEDGEIQEVDMQAQAENIRTVFSDPGNFNVKVRPSFCFHRWSVSDRVATLQHPLFSAWTLWFDSPSTKGRNLPQTPISAFPQTPVLQTPGAQAAQGWMEDIKRVINFDSVEEFWG